MAVLQVPGASLDHEVDGEGPALVQLHGLTSSRRRDHLLGLDVASRLADVRLLSYDARGHGRSSGRPVPGDYRWPTLADDLEHLLRQVFDFEHVHGVGCSMGAGTLLHAATTRPGRFSSLTLVLPPTAWRTRRERASEHESAAGLIERDGMTSFLAVDDVADVPPAAEGRPHTVPDVQERLLPSVLRGAARSDLPDPEALRSLDVPTLILAWVDDPTHPTETAERLVDLLPQARLVVAETPADVARWPSALQRHVRGER